MDMSRLGKSSSALHSAPHSVAAVGLRLTSWEQLFACIRVLFCSSRNKGDEPCSPGEPCSMTDMGPLSRCVSSQNPLSSVATVHFQALWQVLVDEDHSLDYARREQIHGEILKILVRFNPHPMHRFKDLGTLDDSPFPTHMRDERPEARSPLLCASPSSDPQTRCDIRSRRTILDQVPGSPGQAGMRIET
jgi:hypothetical protein